MNYGFVSLDSEPNFLDLAEEDENDRYFIQLYNYADFRSIDEVSTLQQIFERSELKLIKFTDITRNILQALELINEPRQAFIQTYSPFFLKDAFQEFAAVKNSKMYKAFQRGRFAYLSYVLEK